ncbi:MAG: hypothetical protein HY812_02635 [Planctomycetes bacterium]|nr:hypothetical protein [Planctomycetota bacterium]
MDIQPIAGDVRAAPGAWFDPVLAGAGAPREEEGATGFARFLFGDDGFSFGDILDVVNPLQHIPVVSTVYRALTGDEIGNAPRLLGGGLLGGLAGAGGAVVNVVVKETTGRDLGEHALALVTPDEPPAAWDAPAAEQPAFASMLDVFEREFGGEEDALALNAQAASSAQEPASLLALERALGEYRASSAADAALAAARLDGVR